MYNIGQQFWTLDSRPLNQLFHEVFCNYTLENSGSHLCFFILVTIYSHKKIPATQKNDSKQIATTILNRRKKKIKKEEEEEFS